MKIYTKTGDDGGTGLFGGRRVSKASVRVEAYGQVDELNSALGYARTLGVWPELDGTLKRIQSELFDLGSNLATPADSPFAASLPKITDEHVEQMEREIDAAETECEPLKSFILPGGTQLAAWLHTCRTIARRAERAVVTLRESEGVEDVLIRHLNRLSDLLFVLGRQANARAGVAEPKWQPRA